ncbi:transmembrane protein 177 [Euwallacea fornicatus]|uniref:transmembrane protein 177 n=1 Tax=Euwallacea fornicatus TaxID=995702 RepID=UPI00338E1D80
MSNIGLKIRRWLLSENGKKWLYLGSSTVTISLVLGHVLPHTILVTHYKELVQFYNKGISVPVSDVLLQRFEKTLDLLNIHKSERFRFEPFMASGFDMFSIGAPGRFGVHIGMPVNFRYNKEMDVDKSNIRVNQASVIWDTDEGRQLIKSLIVPENAQMYAIARDIKMRDSFKLCFDTAYAFFFCTMTYTTSTMLNQKLNLYVKPQALRFFSYGLVGLFSFGYYIMIKDLTQNYYEKKIDLELKELSPIFAEGGREFYTKILERNKALRILMGKEGESVYTALGNDNFFLRNKHLPIVQRKAFFEEKSGINEEVVAN